MTTETKNRIPWYLWPFAALWKLLAVIVEMTGRLVAMILGIVLMIVGVLISLTIVGAIVGVPLAVVGLLLFIILRLIPGRSAHMRYTISTLAIWSIVIMSLSTFIIMSTVIVKEGGLSRLLLGFFLSLCLSLRPLGSSGHSGFLFGLRC